MVSWKFWLLNIILNPFNPVFMKKEVTLLKNCAATIIPAGDEVILAEGQTYSIAQSLGGSVTLRDGNGMYRVGEGELSALGEEIKKEVERDREVQSPDKSFSEEVVWEALSGCYDPEIPVNIVDLGLVYDLKISGQDNLRKVDVKMTLTAQGCGMGPVIADDAKTRIEALPQVSEVSVDIIWDPPWNPRMMSAEGKRVLGLE
jgi:probable FeS assembly SUF system protein SufT